MRKKLIFLMTVICLVAIPALAISQSNISSLSDFIKNDKNKGENTKVLMTVNDQKVTQGDYLAALKVQKINIEDMQKTKSKMASEPPTEKKDKFMKQIDKKVKAGNEKMAMLKVLYDNIIISEAKKKGVYVSLDEATKYTNQIKLYYGQNQSSPEMAEVKEFITNMGEDYYWNVYAPQKYQIGLSAVKLKKEITKGSFVGEKKALWNDYLTELAINAKIEFKDSNLGITRQELIDHILDYNE